MTAPGWYPDPAGGPGQRYFDGTQWTGARRLSEPPPPGRGLGSGAKIAIGGAVALAALLVLGIVTSETPDDTESAEPATTREPTNPTQTARALPTMQPISPPCRPAPPVLVDMINSLFTSGEHLEHTQSVHAPDATYIGGNIIGADGRKVSSQDTWVELDGAIFAITSDARRRTLAPDGRDLAGIDMEWPTYNAAVNECVGVVERQSRGR